MDERRIPLYDRLPEIYRIRDEEQTPPGQLKSYLGLVETVFEEIHKNIESLYHDFFIDTCDDWVIPYIGDLLGVSRLSGEDWTLRADVADAVGLRRRKGTLSAIERLVFNLTGWGVHGVELRENLVWSQHLNHQRPDEGGAPPYSLPSTSRFTPVRGGTVTLRDPAMLSLLGSPFDPFAHTADLKPPAFDAIRYNLPNLAVFLWRLEDYTVRLSKPLVHPTNRTGLSAGDVHIVRFHVDPLGRPIRLFNTFQFDPDREPPVVTELDRTPGPMPTARLTSSSEAGRPEKYVAVNTYEPESGLSSAETADVGLQLHLPQPYFSGEEWPDDEHADRWAIRGANLCGWEAALPAAVQNREIVIDPVIGRIVFGVNSSEEAEALEAHLLATYTYGAVGPVGAHPTDRFPVPEPWNADSVIVAGGVGDSPKSLNDAVAEAVGRREAAFIEIRDSLIHVLDLTEIDGLLDEDGGPNLSLQAPLLIRAADGERPVIQLMQPLRFRPQNPAEADELVVRLEGLYLTRDEILGDEPLIARAVLNRLEIIHCTLDPGGHRVLDGSPEGSRAPTLKSLVLHEPYGFRETEDENAFDQTPEIILQKTVAGPLRIDRGYLLELTDAIIDAGETAETSFAVAGVDDPPLNGNLAGGWGPPTEINGITVFGRMRVERIQGKGGIWVHTLEVLNNQVGCIKFSYLSGLGDRTPRCHGCVEGFDAPLHFVSEVFGRPGYGQLAHTTDFRIRERGPRDDAMGAFGFLLEAHKWRNLQIRFREFMPVGVKPLLIPVT